MKKIKRWTSMVCAAVLGLTLFLPHPPAAYALDNSRASGPDLYNGDTGSSDLYSDTDLLGSYGALSYSLGAYPQRIFGTTLYDTAIAISQAGWTESEYAVLATGKSFQDALAGTVLAHKLGAPLLLTETKELNPEVLTELKRLNTRSIFILGGNAVVSPEVEASLKGQGFAVERLAGYDQYATATEIAKKVTTSAPHAFLVTGERYPDALSVSSYAAAQGIPLLMTTKNTLPQDTIDALAQLGVQEVTIIGGTGVISEAVATQLAGLPSPVKVRQRLAGYDQYETNTIVLNALSFNANTVFIATGENFPDALAGAALASKNSQPIVLVPKDKLPEYTAAYLNGKRSAGSAFSIFGGWGVINDRMENMIRTGSGSSRISLQYVQGSSYTGQLNQISVLPVNSATDYADLVGTNWLFLEDSSGLLTGPWDGTNNYTQVVAAIHARNLKALPVVQSSWSTTKIVDDMLASPAARSNVQQQLLKRVQDSGADGIIIDFEYISASSQANLTQFMKETYELFHPLNKLVVQAVMSRTNESTWAAFNYKDLSNYVDYLHIMTYDYIKSSPGTNAPLSWMENVLIYTRDQGVNMNKVLLGIPFYGRDWTKNADGSYDLQSRGLYSIGGSGGIDGAVDRLNQYKATLQRDVSKVPYFTYTDTSGKPHTVYYDDQESWAAKLALLSKYDLGGIGAWSLYWVSDETAKVLFPLLKQYLR